MLVKKEELGRLAFQDSLSQLRAKGSLITVDGNLEAAELPVGINGKVLTADDTSPLGIIWKEATGGFKQVFVSANYTASSLDLVEVNSLSSAITITLPASGMVEVYDAGGNCAVNNITVKDASANTLAILDVNYGDILFRYNTITSSWDAQNLSANNGLIYPVTLSDESVPVVASKNYVGEATAGQTVITPGFTWRTSWTGITLFIGGVKQAPGSFTVNSIGGGLSSQITLSEALVGGETIDFTALDISSVPSLQGIVDKLALQSTQVTNAGFGVWSNGTLESAVSSVNLIANGEFETDTSGWTAISSAILTRDTSTFANGVACLKVTNNGATQGIAYIPVQTVVGHVYKIAGYCKRGTTANCGLGAATSSSGAADIGFSLATNTAFSRLDLVFEAVGTTTYIYLFNDTSSGGYSYFDSISMYNMGPNLATNGTFNSTTTGWTAVNGTITSVSGGVNGNCLKITNSSVQAYAYQKITGLQAGKLYRVAFSQKNGTVGGVFGVGNSPASQSLVDIRPGNASWAQSTALFESDGTSIYITLWVNSATASVTTLFDSITLTEVTVGCVDYNTKALDLWTKDNATQCWRETIDTKEGSYYALRVYNGAVYWSDGNRAAKPEFYRRYAGRAAAEGMWVKCSTANKARIGITDSAGTTWSSYHSGGGSYEWLEVTRTPGAGITSYNIVLDSGTSTEAKFSQPQLQFGTSVGQGNFVPIPGEYISLESGRSSSALEGKTFSTTTLSLNVLVDSIGAIPKGAKGVYIYTNISDSISNLSYLLFSDTASSSTFLNQVTGTNSARRLGGVVFCTYGILSAQIIAGGTNTFSAAYVHYNGVQL